LSRLPESVTVLVVQQDEQRHEALRAALAAIEVPRFASTG